VPDREPLGAYIRAARRKLRLSQVQVSLSTGIDQAEISRIESGRANPTQETFDRLGSALGLSLSVADVSSQRQNPTPSSSYATGGGGVAFEFLVAAHFLTTLLSGRSVKPLWEGWSLVAVAFQQRAAGADFDDLVLTAGGVGGQERRIEVAIRHRPSFTSSDKGFVELAADALRSLDKRPREYAQDLRRLALVVATRTPNAALVRELTDLARANPTPEINASALSHKRQAIRQANTRLRAAVDLAAKSVDPNAEQCTEELYFNFLRALFVVDLDLEGDAAADRHARVNDLVGSVDDADFASAASVFSELVRLSAEWDPAEATVDEALLRRRVGEKFRLPRSDRFPSAWSRLRRLTDRAVHATNSDLHAGFSLPRTSVVAELKQALDEFPIVLVRGEPGAGKSAAILVATQDRRGELVRVVLRDLPPTVLEFEHQLGGGLKDVLAGAQRGVDRPLLIIDGAEAVLENRESLLRDILGAIPNDPDGWNVCIVSRTEGSKRVEGLVAQLHPDWKTKSIDIPGFDDAELELVTARFPQLRHLLAEKRSRWLLRRPFHLGLVLRDQMQSVLGGKVLSESDLMTVFWQEIVRLGEVMGSAKGSPDGRDLTLSELASGQLRDEPQGQIAFSEPAAISGLRADGVLLSVQASRRGKTIDFAHDVLRDFAVAQVLLKSALLGDHLAAAQAPRWSLHACRLAAQHRLHKLDGQSVVAEFSNLISIFASIASEHGERWAEVPYEALLTVGGVEEAMTALWGDLTADEGVGIRSILSVLDRRFTVKGYMADVTVWESALKVILEGATQVPDHLLEDLDKMIERFLASVSAAEIGANPDARVIGRASSDVIEVARGYLTLRAQTLHLRRSPVRSLALLGPAVDEAVAAALTLVGEKEPDALHALVEDPLAVRRLLDRDPDLLLRLSEAYYIQPPIDDPRWGTSWLDEGVRRHRQSHIGFPFSAWYFGPFWLLLRYRPWPAIGFVNRMLDSAAQARVTRLGSTSVPGANVDGVTLDLPEFGERHYVGDDHVYRWYRGTAVGPDVCGSALLAVERFCDEQIAIGTPMRTIASFLLKDCHNLAMVGLLVGTLTRFIEKAGTELDPFLSSPEIWALEAARVASEFAGFRSHKEEPAEGQDRRTWTFSQVAGYMVLSDRPNRLEALRSMREQLVARDPQNATLRNWASQLDPERYTAESVEGGIRISMRPPDDVLQELEQLQAPGHEFMRMQQLAFNYGPKLKESRVDPEALRRDLAAIRADLERFKAEQSALGADAMAAVAAAALDAYWEEVLDLSTDDVEWCTSTILELAQRAPTRSGDFGVIAEEKWEMGWDRVAARSLPLIAIHNPDDSRLGAAFRGLGQSRYHETLGIFGTALAAVWRKSCTEATTTRNRYESRCLHVLAFDGVEEMIQNVGIGAWDNALQRRPRERLGAPTLDAIRSRRPDRIDLGSMEPVINAVSICASIPSCVSTTAREYLDALLDLHIRARVYWASGSHPASPLNAGPIHQIVAARVLDGEVVLIDRHVSGYAEHADLLATFLESFRWIAESSPRKKALARLWPALMDRVIDMFQNRPRSRRGDRGVDDLAEALIPLRPRSLDQENWPNTVLLEPQLMRLIAWRGGDESVINRLTEFVEDDAVDVQLGIALKWMAGLVVGSEHYLANRSRIGAWLRQLRDKCGGQIPTEHKPQWLRVVDALAAAGDRASIRLQQEEE